MHRDERCEAPLDNPSSQESVGPKIPSRSVRFVKEARDTYQAVVQHIIRVLEISMAPTRLPKFLRRVAARFA
jgi:hypothetical protein